MDTSNYLDLGIGLVQATFIVFLAWKAFIVSLNVPPEAEHRKHKAIFGLCCVVAVGLSGIQIYRNFGLNQKLDKIEANTEKPQPAPIVNVSPPIINIPPMPSRPEHTIVSWDDVSDPLVPQPGPFFPFSKNERPKLNMGYSNVGDFSVISNKEHGALLLVPFSDSSKAYKENIRQILKTEAYSNGTLTPHSPSHSYHTFIGPALSEQDIADLNSGNKMLCGIGAVEWTDKTGTYRTSYNECFYHQVSGTFNWHVGSETNLEEKLK